jgi:hypothetical protein
VTNAFQANALQHVETECTINLAAPLSANLKQNPHDFYGGFVFQPKSGSRIR